MEFAVGRRAVAVAAKVTKDIVQTKRRWAGQTVVAMVLRVLPGQNAHPARRADRILAVGFFKPHAGCRKRVEFWGQGLRVPGAAHPARVELVGEDHDHIRFHQSVEPYDSDGGYQ